MRTHPMIALIAGFALGVVGTVGVLTWNGNLDSPALAPAISEQDYSGSDLPEAYGDQYLSDESSGWAPVETAHESEWVAADDLNAHGEQASEAIERCAAEHEWVRDGAINFHEYQRFNRCVSEVSVASALRLGRLLFGKPTQ